MSLICYSTQEQNNYFFYLILSYLFDIYFVKFLLNLNVYFSVFYTGMYLGNKAKKTVWSENTFDKIQIRI